MALAPNRTNPLSFGARVIRSTFLGLLAAFLTYSWWHEVSPWASVPIALTAAIIADMFAVFRIMIPLPHFAVVIACLQYGLAPLAAHYYPASNFRYDIHDLPGYFAFAGPVMLATALGWMLAGATMTLQLRPLPSGSSDLKLKQELDWLFWGGLGLMVVRPYVGSGGLAFLLELLTNLRFLGVTGMILLQLPGWRWRTLALLFIESMSASNTGMFHDFILWSLCLVGAWTFIKRPRPIILFVGLTVATLGIFALQNAKWTIRQATWDATSRVVVFGRTMEFSGWTRPFVAGLCIVDSATKIFGDGYANDFMGDTILRFNQGWIIERVMEHVPSAEPYAEGRTLVQALSAALLPRIIAPNKMIAGGTQKMKRYTNYDMSVDTSMNLGFAGEMYANFGRWGGIIGVAIYALLLGLLFRVAATRAMSASPLWWAMTAYVGHLAFKAETDVGSVLNYLVKALLVVSTLVVLLPAIRAELSGWRDGVKIPKPATKKRSSSQTPGLEFLPPVAPDHKTIGRHPLYQRGPSANARANRS